MNKAELLDLSDLLADLAYDRIGPFARATVEGEQPSFEAIREAADLFTCSEGLRKMASRE